MSKLCNPANFQIKKCEFKEGTFELGLRIGEDLNKIIIF